MFWIWCVLIHGSDLRQILESGHTRNCFGNRFGHTWIWNSIWRQNVQDLICSDPLAPENKGGQLTWYPPIHVSTLENRSWNLKIFSALRAGTIFFLKISARLNFWTQWTHQTPKKNDNNIWAKSILITLVICPDILEHNSCTISKKNFTKHPKVML